MMKVEVRTSFNPNMTRDVQNAIIATLDRISGAAQKVAVVEAPNDTGQGANSIQIVRRFRAPVFIGGIQTNVPHMLVQEFGRRPGTFPPFFPIARWVMRNRGKFGGAIKKFGGGKRGMSSLIFVIRRNIARKGIPSNPRFDSRGFFKKAELAITQEFSREISALGLAIQQAWDTGGR